MVRFCVLIAVLLAALAAPLAVRAQALCAPREDAIAQLKSTFGETVRYRGMDSRGMVVETLVSEDSGSWTMLFTRPDGVACVGAAGDSWESVDPAPVGDGA